MKILKRRLREARSDGERWTLIRQCYLEYKTYDVDSAAHYVKEMEALLRNTVANPHFQRDKKIIPKH